MIVSRLNAYGEVWKQWCEEGIHMSRNRVIPEKHQDKKVIFSEFSGEYCLHCALTDELGYVRAQAEEARASGATRAPRTRFAPEPPLRAAPTAPRAGPAAPTSQGPAQLPRAAEPADVTNARDEWRDMAGDALTTQQAWARGLHAQCSLASVRNIRRQENYTRERLAERQLFQEYPLDIRFPDWPALMQPILHQGEVVKRAQIDSVPALELLDFRIAVVIHSRHVIALINDDDGAFRMYDNDSAERRQGTYATKRADEIIDSHPGGHVFGVLMDGSDLSLRLGPAVTTAAAPGRPRAPAPARPAAARATDPPAQRTQTIDSFFRRGHQLDAFQ